MADDVIREILARELFVRRYSTNSLTLEGGPGRIAAFDRRTRESWYRRLNDERRERWREMADLLIGSLNESNIKIDSSASDG